MSIIKSEINSLPKISVIVPLYNAEKYIAQCLESLINQTFKEDYEILVIDDCSTDGSFEIVKSFVKKSNGLIRLIKRKWNSGTAAIPRNMGIRLARGKYVAFIDNDDMFTPNALKDMYEAAEKTQADIVHAEKWLIPKDKSGEINKDTAFGVTTYEKNGFVDKITVETDDIAKRVNLFCQERMFWNIWTSAYRREFLNENYIEFPNMIIADDMIFTFYCICLAKKYVRVPSIFNIYRYRGDSFSNNRSSAEKIIHNWVTVMVEGTKALDKFMSEMDFFVNNPEIKYSTLDYFVKKHLSYTAAVYAQVPAYKFYDIVKKEFDKNPADNVTLTTHLYNIAEIYRLNIQVMTNKINQLQQQIQELKNK